MRSHFASRWLRAISIVSILAVSAGALAQTDVTTSRVSGTVKDTEGGVLPGVNVTARNQETGLEVTTTSDGDGFYRLLNLPTGTYTLTVHMAADAADNCKAQSFTLPLTAQLRSDAS